mmetsp:Transcript_32286/g.78779  ORF Transcript_32286/g.78779 Transcript_32286/m.78779 type:complete len:106 (+) Transcript_32286:2875-3192(+)
MYMLWSTFCSIILQVQQQHVMCVSCERKLEVTYIFLVAPPFRLDLVQRLLFTICSKIVKQQSCSVLRFVAEFLQVHNRQPGETGVEVTVQISCGCGRRKKGNIAI